MFTVWLVIIKILLSFSYPSSTFYISPYGNDKNNGLTPAKAWRTLQKINSIHFKPGDKILLEGGKTFIGNIILDSLDSGVPGKPLYIGSYGKGQAIIYTELKDGLYGVGCSYVNISNLIFKSNGVGNNNISGIHFYNESTKNAREITINNCRAEGFTNYGIIFGAAEKEGAKGYRNVKIENCVATNNGEAGISSYGSQTAFSHSIFYVYKCKAFLNKGNPQKTGNHTGNGIVMSSVENLLIEHCEAYENGSQNRCAGGGPVGIWVWICKNAVIQYCESHHNHAGLIKDGGGFDIDGGSADCVIQYNYSHDNEGAGYLLAEYGAVLPFTRNTIRFNISRNDGRKNNYGGITLWGADTNYRVTNSSVYNNSIYTDTSKLVNGIPCALQVMGKNLSSVLVTNNIFFAGKGARMLYSTENADSNTIWFLSNKYESDSGKMIFTWNSIDYTSIQDWRNALPGQEKWYGNPFDLSSLKITRGSYDVKGKKIDKGIKDFFGAELK